MRAFSRSRLLPSLFLVSAMCAWSAGPVFNVLDYGARNDGSAPATAAIRSAIQAAQTAGGGTVYLPGGNYVTGPIALVQRGGVGSAPSDRFTGTCATGSRVHDSPHGKLEGPFSVIMSPC